MKHTYYLLGVKQSNDDYLKTLFNKKRELYDDKDFYKSLKFSNNELIRTEEEIVVIENLINENIIKNKLIKQVLFSSMGDWYLYYKKRRN